MFFIRHSFLPRMRQRESGPCPISLVFATARSGKGRASKSNSSAEGVSPSDSAWVKVPSSTPFILENAPICRSCVKQEARKEGFPPGSPEIRAYPADQAGKGCPHASENNGYFHPQPYPPSSLLSESDKKSGRVQVCCETGRLRMRSSATRIPGESGFEAGTDRRECRLLRRAHLAEQSDHCSQRKVFDSF